MPDSFVTLSMLFDDPDTVLTEVAPGDLHMILDVSEPDEAKRLKVAEHKNVVSRQVVLPLHIRSGDLVLQVGDGLSSFRIPAKLNGYELVSLAGAVHSASTSGIPTFQVARGRQAAPGTAHAYADMLTTKLSIDVNEYDSKDAVDQPVVNAAFKGVLTGDIIRIDCDIAGTGTKGLELELVFALP